MTRTAASDAAAHEGVRREPESELSLPEIPRVLEHAWTLACVALAAWLCLHGLAQVFLMGDEFHSLASLDLGFAELARTYDDNGSGLALPILQKAASALFGHHLCVYRLPAILGALGTLLLVSRVARRVFGRPSALLASAAVATSAIHVFYSRYGRGYSLGAFFALLFVLCLLRALERAPARRRWLAGVGIAGGLLPVVHLSAAPFALGAGLGALWSARRSASLRPLSIALAAGALLALGLHLPAWAGLRAFLGEKALEGPPTPFEALDVATLLAGSRAAGWVVLVALPLAALAFALRKGPHTALVLAGPGALVAGLLVMRPAGLSLAYARYLFVAWPLCLMLLAWSWVELVRRLPVRRLSSAPRAGAYLALASGALLLYGAWLAGPLGLAHVPDGRFANSYHALHPLPAFDVPFARASRFYGELAERQDPVRIVEFPLLRTRGLLLYRNHWLRHGKEVVLGHLADRALRKVTGGPYLDLSGLGILQRAGVDFVVVHHDIDNELANYWLFVQDEAWPEVRRAGDESVMAAHSSYGGRSGHGRTVPQLERALRKRLGPPIHEDATVRVWELTR